MLKLLFPFLLIVVCMLAGCQTKREKVTKEEAMAFNRSLEKDVSDLKIDFIEKNIIFPVLFEKMNSSNKIASSKGLENGIRRGLSSNNYERAVYDIIAGTGSFEMINHYEADGKQHLIYRIYGPGGFNYIDVELAKVDKKTGIGDMYLHANGENFSKSMGELADKLAGHQGTAIEDNIVAVINKMKQYMEDRNYRQAKAQFLRLPYDIRSSRLYEITYLDILSKISEEEYFAELEKTAIKYEARKGYDLLLLDVYLSRKDFDKALASLDRLDSAVHKDPFLDYYRGLINNMKADTAKALGYFEKVTKTMPGFADNYAELFAHYSAGDNKEMAKKYFDKYKSMKHKNPEVVSFYETQYPYLAN